MGVTRLLKEGVSKHYIFLIFLVVWSGLVVGYVVYLNPDVISRDQWRFLPLVDQYFRGELTFQSFLEGQAHVKPVYMVLFLLNAAYIGLDFLPETLAGIVALLLSATVLYSGYRQSYDLFQESWRIQLSFVLIGIILLSFNQVQSYSYSLLSFAGYTGLLMIVLIFSLFNQSLLEGNSKKRLIMLAALIAIASFSFLGGRGPAVFVALMVAAFLKFVADKGSLKSVAVLITITVFSFILAQVPYWLLSHSAGAYSNVSGGVSFVIQNILGSLQYFLAALANGSFDVNHLIRVYGFTWEAITVLGGGVALLYIGAFVLFWKLKLYQKSYTPLMLMIYSLAFIGEVLIARYGIAGLGNSASPRYVFNFQLGMVGVIWIYLLAYFSSSPVHIKSNHWKAIGVIALAAIICINELHHMGIQYKRFPFAKNLIERSRVQVTESDFTRSRWFCPAEKVCSDGVEIMKKYKLNVFREYKTL